MNLTIHSTITLNNGIEMPRFGLGVFRAGQGRETQDAVRWALETGYRHIDTAAGYNNEVDVGIGIRQSGVPRQEVFVVTKLRNNDHGFDTALRACDESLEKLGMDYIDLYLIHWPVTQLRGDSWKALLRLYEEGKCRAIGVSNYMIRHLDELLADTPLVPAVDQVEFTPFLYRKELLETCHANGIVLESYSPLTRNQRLEDPTLVTVAEKYDKTPAQIAIRWCLQQDVIVIPKSTNRNRIAENADVFDFEISAEDMATLNDLHDGFTVIPPHLDPETSSRWD